MASEAADRHVAMASGWDVFDDVVAKLVFVSDGRGAVLLVVHDKVGLNSKNPPGLRFLKFVKVTGHTFSCNDLTNFKYQVRAMTGNGNFANLFEFTWKNSGNLIRWKYFLADFSTVHGDSQVWGRCRCSFKALNKHATKVYIFWILRRPLKFVEISNWYLKLVSSVKKVDYVMFLWPSQNIWTFNKDGLIVYSYMIGVA